MKFVRSTLVIATALTIAAVLPAGALSSPTWQSAENVALPSGATSVAQGYLPILSCPSAGNCVAGGAYSDAKGDVGGLLLNEVGGVWKNPTKLTPPTNAAAGAAVTIYSVSCGTVDYCTAVGAYQDKSGNAQAFVDDELNGTWRSAVEVTLPANSLASSQNAQLRTVACTSAGVCTALGTYWQSASPLPRTEGFAVTEVRNAWGNGREIVLPSGTNANPFVALNQVACASQGNCSAIGQYIDANNVTHGLLVSEVGGTWRDATSLTLPGNASAYAGASLSSIACDAPTSCSAVGTYTNASGQIEALATSGTNGNWTRALALAMPTGAAANPHAFFYGFTGVSCASIGNCSAGGQYRDASGNYQGFLIDEVHGSWQVATRLKLPSGGTQAGHNGGVVSVSCASAGNCSAGAAYLDSSGNYQATVISEIAGTWQTGVKISLPGGATSVGVDGGVYSVSCNAANACTAVGSYLVGASSYRGFTLASR